MKMFDKLSQEMADQRVETIQVRVLLLPWRALFLVLLLLSCADALILYMQLWCSQRNTANHDC